jgi:selenocysteine lyase/cysteine desulfurase
MSPDPGAFRAQFPVLQTRSYLNAGTEGPVPRAAADAVRERLAADLAEGRCGRTYHEAVRGLAAEARAGYAAVLGCSPNQVALTGSTTDGVNTVLGGFPFRPGDEVLTSDEEHPGLLAPLALARRRHGLKLRVAPFAELPGAVTPRTRLIACSHVSWVSGRVADVEALQESGAPMLLDAAQALGAIPVDVRALGCDFYAASGQKWLCGPEGSGCLYVRPERLEELEVPWPGYASLADPEHPLESPPAPDAARLDHGFPAAARSAWALASLRTLAQPGWAWVHERAASLAAWLADALAERGLEVAPRGRSTIVSWRAADPEAEVERLARERIVVRFIPRFSLVRASVGAWSSEEELARLVELAAA